MPRGRPAKASGVNETLWCVADLAEMIDASLAKPGKRGHYKKTPRRFQWAILGVALALLSGCSEEKLKACVASTEPTLLLRQLALTGTKKQGFERCLSGAGQRNHCSVIYLDADNALTQCMSEKGYAIRRGVAECDSYYEPKCYAPNWLWEIQKVLGFQNPK